MANFDADTLRELRDVQEVRIRTEKHPKSAVVIWVVVADDEVFVRSWRGAEGRWYRDLAAGCPATLEYAGRRRCQVNLSRSEKPEAGCAITLSQPHSAILSPLRLERSAALIERR